MSNVWNLQLLLQGGTNRKEVHLHLWELYLILFYRGHVIDSITFGEMFGEELEVAKADRMQNWIRTPMMQLNPDCYDLAMRRKVNKENKDMDDDEKKKLRLKYLEPIWNLETEIFQFV